MVDPPKQDTLIKLYKKEKKFGPSTKKKFGLPKEKVKCGLHPKMKIQFFCGISATFFFLSLEAKVLILVT